VFYNLFSCRTVEVNNTDAEGRLVLGDGVRSALVFYLFRSFLDVYKSSVTLSYFGHVQNYL